MVINNSNVSDIVFIKKKLIMKKELTKYLLIPLILVSFYVNYYYGSKGVLAVDTFSHFDSAYKLLKGVIIFRDFWNISGGVIDYLQLPFFIFLGLIGVPIYYKVQFLIVV